MPLLYFLQRNTQNVNDSKPLDKSSITDSIIDVITYQDNINYLDEHSNSDTEFIFPCKPDEE